MSKQWVVQEASDRGPRNITDGTSHIRLVTEEHIKGLNTRNTRAMLDSVSQAQAEVHRAGTPQAIRAIDYLVATVSRHLASLRSKSPDA